MNMWVKKTFLLLLLFTIIYKPEFIFIPHSVNMFFGLIGFLVFISRPESRTCILKVSNANFNVIIKSAIPFVIVSLFSIVLNGSQDFYYPRYAISLILSFLSAYLISFLFFDIYGYMSVEKFIDYFIIAECFFLFIGLVSYFNIDIQNMLVHLQKTDIIEMNSLERTKESRLISIGAKFFSAAVINGFVLILIGLQFYCTHLSISKKILYFIAFAYILVVGLMMGRTTTIGGFIGLFLIILSFAQTLEKSVKSVVAVILSASTVYLVYTELISLVSWNFDSLYDFGFEMFINYQNGNGFSAHSNEGVAEMYNILPTDLPTWLIGDAQWDCGNHYYKYVDPGYLRGLWYFGIIGLVALLWHFFRIIYYVTIEKRIFNDKKVVPFIALLLYTLILNSKGPANLYFYLIPFFFCDKFSNHEEQIIGLMKIPLNANKE